MTALVVQHFSGGRAQRRQPGEDGHAQSFWQALPESPGVPAKSLVGAVLYEHGDARFIYLFAKISSAGGDGLLCLRYDLDTAAWAADWRELALPSTHPVFIRTIVDIVAGVGQRRCSERLGRSWDSPFGNGNRKPNFYGP